MSLSLFEPASKTSGDLFPLIAGLPGWSDARKIEIPSDEYTHRGALTRRDLTSLVQLGIGSAA